MDSSRTLLAVMLLPLLSAACMTTPGDACVPGRALSDTQPIATGDGPVTAIHAAADAERLTDATELWIRVVSDDAVRLFVDVDGDRTSGMWTYQSPVSAGSWDLLVEADGTLLRHEGPPTEWAWTPIGRVERSRGTGFVDICLASSTFAGAERVRLGALTGDDGWLPAPFERGAAFPPAEPESAPGPAEPAPLAFHYGERPWLVRGCPDPDCAIDVYRPFAHVVLGAGLEDPARDTHDLARVFVDGLRGSGTEVWGYVSMVGSEKLPDGRREQLHDADDITRLAERWRALGATGVFLDEADLCRPDWGQECPRAADGTPVRVSKDQQRKAITAIHDAGLAAFVNALAPLDVVGQGDDDPPTLVSGDMVLVETPTLAGGVARTGLDLDAARVRLTTARRGASALGIRMAAVDTTAGAAPDDPDDATFRQAWDAATDAGVDAYGFTNAVFSASGALVDDLSLAVTGVVAA